MQTKYEFSKWCDRQGGEYNREVDMGDQTLTCKKDFKRAKVWIPEEGEPRLNLDLEDNLVDGRHGTEFGIVKKTKGDGYGDRWLVVKNRGEENLVDMDGYTGDIDWN